jgi:putative FmdB family regulatory protein
MLLFDYVCDHCGERFEVFLGRGDDEDEVLCPSCGKPARRELGGFATRSAASGPIGACGPSGWGGG